MTEYETTMQECQTYWRTEADKAQDLSVRLRAAARQSAELVDLLYEAAEAITMLRHISDYRADEIAHKLARFSDEIRRPNAQV